MGPIGEKTQARRKCALTHPLGARAWIMLYSLDPFIRLENADGGVAVAWDNLEIGNE
jgi:hypothetical protein